MRWSRVVVAGVLLAEACGGEASPDLQSPGSILVDTLESGRVVVTVPDSPLWTPGEECAFNESFRVGAANGDGSDVFIGPLQVVLGSAGKLFLLDTRGTEVYAFGPQGEHLFTLGQRGQGPGEFGFPTGIALDPDGILWISDHGNLRYSGFDPTTGILVREGRRQFLAATTLPWPGGFDRAGRLLDVSVDQAMRPIAVVLDSLFVVQDTLPLPALSERFAPEAYWAVHPDGGIVVGEGQAYRLHHIDVTGDTVMTIELLRPPAPHTPAHGPLFVDDQGRMWVQPAKSAMIWDVFSAEGELLGQVKAPSIFVGSPSVRGDRMALTTIGSGPLHEHMAIVYDLVCPGGAF